MCFIFILTTQLCFTASRKQTRGDIKMGMEVIWALGLFGILLLIGSLKGITKFFRNNKYNMDITFDKNLF